MSIGIYKIENNINHHIYVGQSVNIEKRWKREIAASQLSADHSYDYPLQRAFRKYGVENFSFDIIETCSLEELNAKEIYWIHYYDSFFHGYNQTLGGEHHILAPKDNIINVIHDLETTNLYHREIAEKNNISIEMVQGINTGRYWFDPYRTYPIQTKFKDKATSASNYIKKENFCIDCGKKIGLKANRCVECAQKASRKVCRPSKEELYDYLISIQGNFSEASRHFGVSDNAVRKWCRKYEIPSTSAEYKRILNGQMPELDKRGGL